MKVQMMATLEVREETIWIWVNQRGGRNVLRAELPRSPAHPRALLAILEALALYSGEQLLAVLGVDRPLDDSLGLGSIGSKAWPDKSALVDFFVRQPARPPHRLDVCEACHMPDCEGLWF